MQEWLPSVPVFHLKQHVAHFDSSEPVSGSIGGVVFRLVVVLDFIVVDLSAVLRLGVRITP